MSLRPILTDIEVLKTLYNYSHSTRVAILLSAMTDITPNEIMILRWCNITPSYLNAECVKLLNSLPRLLNSDLVFWEAFNGKISPLVNFEDDLAKFIETLGDVSFKNFHHNTLSVSDSSEQFLKVVYKNLL